MCAHLLVTRRRLERRSGAALTQCVRGRLLAPGARGNAMGAPGGEIEAHWGRVELFLAGAGASDKPEGLVPARSLATTSHDVNVRQSMPSSASFRSFQSVPRRMSSCRHCGDQSLSHSSQNFRVPQLQKGWNVSVPQLFPNLCNMEWKSDTPDLAVLDLWCTVDPQARHYAARRRA